jgi:hypothetical protein
VKGGQPAPVTSGFPVAHRHYEWAENELIPIARKNEANTTLQLSDHHSPSDFRIAGFCRLSASSKDTSYPENQLQRWYVRGNNNRPMSQQSGAFDVDKLDSQRKIIRKATLI